MAYLNAPIRQTNMSTARAGTRLQKLAEEGAAVPMPPVSRAAQPLLAQFFEVGPFSHGVTGAVPLSFVELHAFAEMTGIDLLPWEASLFRRLSTEYISEAQRAEKHDAPPPWAPAIAIDRDDVARRVRSLFGARAKAKGRPS